MTWGLLKVGKVPSPPYIKHMAKTKAKVNGYNTRLFPGGPPPQY